ncbi:MAG: phosphate acetyltransferase, partial [Candidatus Omnitrophica bacterium]|nr:phosphate acetyltransferase [Candidatus Omnitrophota bacterium]
MPECPFVWKKQMSGSLYITSTEDNSGKSVITLGVMEMLLRKMGRVGFFRPVVDIHPGRKDRDIELIATHFKLEASHEQMYGLTAKELGDLMVKGAEQEAIERIIDKFDKLKQLYEFVLCEGTDFSSSTASYAFDINAEICNNLGCPVLLVAGAFQKTPDEVVHSTQMALESLKEKKCQTVATIINRLATDQRDTTLARIKTADAFNDQRVYTITEDPFLTHPTVGAVAEFMDADILYGQDQLNRHVYGLMVAAMQLRNFLPRIKHGALIIVPGDRADVLVACLATVSSSSAEKISGILLTGGLKPEEPVDNLIRGFSRMVPILSVPDNTFEAATKLNHMPTKISPHDSRKITSALSIFENHIDVEDLQARVITTRATIVTPKFFEYRIIQRARKHKQHIVLPEWEEERILWATENLVQRDIVDITLLGDERRIREKIALLGVHLEYINIIDPQNSPLLKDYIETFYELRKHKNINMDIATDWMHDGSYFGTMMVYKGHADAMVSGAIHSTRSTIRPALEIIKTKPGSSIVSSVFFMCFEDRVLVYGDCAVNANPDANQLAEIALASAQTARDFGIEPIVAMLSYSTGDSGQGADVEKVREATAVARAKAQKEFPELKIEGPIQYDAAIEPSIAKTKMPTSDVAGKATVFIFPDLNTGNNTYKAVQRSAGIIAVGPVLQ